MSGDFLKQLTGILKRHEGLELKPYRCTEGYLTLGIGRNLETKGISEEEAEYLLRNDIEEVVAALNDRIPWWNNLPDHKRIVLASMAFQLGVGGLLKFQNMLAAAEDGDDHEVVAQMRDSRWHRQTTARVEELARLWTGP
jgi:lysozyme